MSVNVIPILECDNVFNVHSTKDNVFPFPDLNYRRCHCRDVDRQMMEGIDEFNLVYNKISKLNIKIISK
jgi:hypothetical protein